MTPGAPDPAGRPAAMVSRPAEVLRVATATREVLEELRSDGLTDAARRRANALYDRSIQQLGDVLSDDLRQELAGLSPPRTKSVVPSTDELRVADAQLSGWLEGLLQSMQAAVVAQHEAAQRHEAERAQADAAARADRQAEAGRRRGNPYL